mmetsp:Transcript_36122/g.72720  ORF Transcript_36122/g.72720 Transcript_36122/m.72720 type:complete len:224 (-) Transcript_36122:412-1083(-)
MMFGDWCHCHIWAGWRGDCLLLVWSLLLARGTALTPHQQVLSDLWDEHCKFEFDANQKSVENTMGTMGARPIVNHVPNLIGGVGKDDLSDFYRHHFIFSNPDVGLHPVSRTIGDSQLVDELVVTMVHDRYVDWLVPRVPPTGLTLHFPLVAIVYFEEEKGRWSIVREHIYWDQATVLVQLGVLDASGLDVSGAEQARKILDVDAEPSNQILERALARRRGEEL